MKRDPRPDAQVADIGIDQAALGPIMAAPPNRMPEDYWSIVGRQFRKNKVAVIGLLIVICFFLIALTADFIANDKPLVMKYQGQVYFPVLKGYAVRLHLSQWQREFQNISY